MAPGRPCLVCDIGPVEQFLDLGEMPLANNFLTADQLVGREPRYPLRVGFCHHCGHVQLMEHVPPPEMFAQYLYVSSVSSTLKGHLHDLARLVTDRCRLGLDDLVIDVGSNDGTLLSGFKPFGVRTLGVDPARNLAALARRAGVDTHVGYFTAKTARDIASRWGSAAVVTATNTFPHIQDLGDFIRALDTVLAARGVFVIEAHYLLDFLVQGAFDTVYHEHVSYWGLGPMIRLFTRYGFSVVDVERLPIHHGQLRVFVQREGTAEVSPAVRRTLDLERGEGLDRFDTFTRFASRAASIRENLRRALNDWVARGKVVAGYGAPAKATTLLSFLGVGPETIRYVVDRSPLKQSRFMPGTHIPIVGPDRLSDEPPDVLLLLAWNFADEIMAQEAEYRRRGGKFIIPLPEVAII